MDKKQEAFLLELLADFKIEAAEHHQAIINGLLALETAPEDTMRTQLIETTFREIHSMKGAARAVNQIEIERLCQTIESVFHLARQGDLAFSATMFDTLYKAVDTLGVMLSEVDLKEKSIGANTIMQLMKRLETLHHDSGTVKKTASPDSLPVKAPDGKANLPLTSVGNIHQPRPIIPAEPVANENTEQKVSADTVRVATSKLGLLLREAEEFISVKATLGFYIRELQDKQDKELSAIVKDMEQFHRSMSRMIDELLLDIKTTLLFPFSSLLEIVPKIVRDLGKTYNKEIRLTIFGGEIEIDRRILEDIKDPMIHLVRNCIDHGLETMDARVNAGKTPWGNLEIAIRQEPGRDIELQIHDDGVGIARDKVIQSSVKLGIVTAEAAMRMTDKEVFALIFRSGVSTSPFITDISGRGLGMAIVAEKVIKLGGSIEMDSTPGQGTTFIINLPVTLSAFRGILVRVNQQLFIIPTKAVEKAIRVFTQDIKTVESKSSITHNLESIALVSLSDVLGLPLQKAKKNDGSPMPVLILALARKKIAFIFDEVLGEHEGMVKNMGPQLVHIRNIAGATILGNGRVIPILNVQELMETAAQVVVQPAVSIETPDMEDAIPGKPKYILVAEDSITLRALLRNIIESAGYRVKTAVDGMEAFQFLKNEAFDLLVSDVEMPRMSGFDLTAKIRSDKRLSETPVILVTALDSADDRQRGMEAGANAYIVKGSFEQSNLIETIRRLI